MKYDPSFVSCRQILSDEDKLSLRILSQVYTLAQFRADTRNYEEVAVDFIYTSAKIEGNTYDRIDTDNLVRMGITAGGKKWSDAVMIVNLRNGFDSVMNNDKPIDIDYLRYLHKILMKDLLPEKEQGLVRMSGVHIGASTYTPIADPMRLSTEIKFILPEVQKYQDPFEKAIYLHCNLAYLQYFRDGNKRTARLMQTASLVKDDVLPLFFSDTLIEQYKRATIGYYETGDYKPYVSFFKENYKLAIANLVGEEKMSEIVKSKLESFRAANPVKDQEGTNTPIND